MKVRVLHPVLQQGSHWDRAWTLALSYAGFKLTEVTTCDWMTNLLTTILDEAVSEKLSISYC